MFGSLPQKSICKNGDPRRYMALYYLKGDSSSDSGIGGVERGMKKKQNGALANTVLLG